MSAVVTGIGWVGSAGCGREALAGALASGTPVVREVDRTAGWHARGAARTAALVEDGALARWVTPAAARRMSRPSRMALAAARMALEDAGRAGEPADGVVLGTAFGPAAFTEKLLGEILADPETASPFLFTECVANAPAAGIALALKARGTNWTITQREAGAVLALGRAAREIEERRASTVLAGAVEEITPLLHAALDRFRALARPRDGEIARPYDRRRSGFLAAEGATVLHLEEEGSASSPLARIVASGGAFDPTASPGGFGRGGAAVGSAIRERLSRIGIEPGSIEAVAGGASGAVDGDRGEAEALRAIFGEAVPPVLAPRGALGVYGGGILGAAVLAVAGAEFARPAGFAETDPELGVLPFAGGELRARRVLVLTLGSGGACGFAVLERA